MADAVASRSGALDGLIVSDFSSSLAGPYLTMLLGDLGATVVKVEGAMGDTTRAWGPPWHEGRSTYFLGVNRNKRSIRLDLRDPADAAIARTLALRSDVLVENLRPGLMTELGLGYDDLGAANPRLVYCSISGFGHQPGGATIHGYDLLAQAVGGLMSVTGPEGGPPLKVGVALVDVLCGLHGAVGILAALASRTETGRGQHVEVELLSSVLAALTNQASGYLLAGHVPGPLGNGHPSVAPYESFSAADGDVVIAVGTDRQFAALSEAIGRPDLATDPRFATNADRVTNRPELRAAIGAAIGDWTRDAVVAALRPRGVPAGPVNDLAEAFTLAESIGLEPTWEIDGDRYVRTPIQLSETPTRPGRRPPDLDEHGPEIRAWLAP